MLAAVLGCVNSHKSSLWLLQVDIETLPAIMSIEAAIEAGSFHTQHDRTIEVGDVDAIFKGEDVAVVVEGDARVGGQEHFYLEPHNCFVQPIEDDEFVLIASTQVCQRPKSWSPFIL